MVQPALIRGTCVLQGNREQYYTADNSLLNSVLSSREGIPISLAVLHAAVRSPGPRAALFLQPLLWHCLGTAGQQTLRKTTACVRARLS